MKRLALILACGALAASCQLPLARGRWNVVVILVDSLRADHLGTYGYGRPTSPRLDALAAESYVFTAARAQSSCTFPSVDSILTGRYPARFLDQPESDFGIPAGVRSLAEVLGARGFATAAVSASPIVRANPGQINPRGGFGRGFGRFDDRCEGREAQCVSNHADLALDHLREPFFLYAHYTDPHSPYEPAQPFRRNFRLGRSEQEWARHGNPIPLSLMLEGRGEKVDYTRDDIRLLESLYDGEIAMADAQIGRLLADLRRRGVLERTIVAVVADHGESFLEHGAMWHCHSLFDEEIRTPFLLRLPRHRGAGRLAGVVENVDLVPTLVDLLGFPVAGQGFEGVSLVPQLEGARPAPRLAFALVGTRRSATDGRYKLIVDLAVGSSQLFDLVGDPGETRDLESARPQVAARLRRALLDWVRRTEGSAALRHAVERAERWRSRGER